MIVFDIETGPRPDAELAALFTPPDPPPHPGEFDASSVRVGNLKDQAKIDAKIAEARAKHEQAVASYQSDCQQAADSAWQSFRDSAALDALTGRVIAIGYCSVDSGKVVIDHDDDERQLLFRWWQKASDCRASNRKLIGLNICGFDLPFLIRRSWMLGVDVPDWSMPQNNRFFDRIYVDLRQVWLLGQSPANCSSNFDHIGKALETGGKPPGVDGSQFADLWETDRDAAIAYLTNDLRQPVEWCKRMGVV